MSEHSSASAVDVVTQLVTGPSVREVATKTLRPALKTLYPDLNIDPQLAMVVKPTWIIQNDKVIPGRPQIESLTDALVRLGLSGTAETYLDGEHFLTLQPDIQTAVQLPVKIDAIGLLLNELAPLLFIAFKEQHVDYWDEFAYPGQPRWQKMSDALRNLWNVDASLGWDADQRAIAHAVYQNPDKQQRLNDAYKTRACLIDLDRDDAKHPEHVTLLDCAVLIGTVEKRTVVLTHSVVHGFQCFDSLDAFGEALPQFWQSVSSAGLKWRLVEPQGHFFDHQACTLIALEAEALGKINFFQDSTLDNLFPRQGSATTTRATPRLKPHIDRLGPLLPAWLDNALPADQTRYSRHLLDLTTVQHSNQGKTFQSEVVSLQKFTRQALKQQMLKEHPTADKIEIDDLQITITSLVVWGTFVLPGNIQTQTLSLSELALQNLAGQPLGNKTVHYNGDHALPDWLTVTYLEKLVSTVDIGKTYPQYLQKLLIDDTRQASELQALYTSQIPIELPLLALQHKIQGKAGMDEKGYRYVAAALGNTAEQRHIDGEEIVIRPLSFIAHRSSSRTDVVNNMFVIGPREVEKGPCVLYRPLFEMALIQYPGHANLLYAIEHSRQLRESVLAWLPDDVRFNYSQFVFTARLPSVWTIPQLLVNPTTAFDMSGPVALGTAAIESDVRGTLYESNVQAVITQAERQSVSDAEARWATLKRGGWMVFNAALPFLGRSAGTAAWIWQIMDDLQEISDVENEQTDKTAWTAIADILLALGMVLAHRAAVGNKPQHESIATTPEETPPVTSAPKTIKPQRLPDMAGTELPVAHHMSLNTVTALKRSPVALAALLDSFKIDKPKELGAEANEGVHRHLYAKQKKWYASVGDRWFEVLINENQDVQIIDSRRHPPLAGPLLTRTAGGQWIIDLRLRLRGGGLRSGREQERGKNLRKVQALIAEIEAFDNTMADKQSQLDAAHNAMHDTSSTVDEAVGKKYLDTLDSLDKAYAANVEKIKSLNRKQTVPNYRTVMIERLQMLLFLGQEWLSQHNTDFQTNVNATISMIADHTHVEPQKFIQSCENITDQTQGIIEKIEAAHARFAELELLGKEAVETVSTYRKALPSYDLNDLKLLQISLGQEICVKPGETATRADAQQALETLIEDAALNIQSSMI
ncbi:dermonecrotic toxin domain-containing protein [Pseudomonas sp. NPDC087614]|uniref:dermonecrotic toxin domain-containing protein n=1 Tax=Pseudomonas sp. NPDC087614 TaxID=3364442 RepID=UPI0037F8B44A